MQTVESPDHHGSHRDLLWVPGDSTAHRGIDAIIVPTARPPAYLAEAAVLAHALHCTLLTLHSKQWTSAARATQRLPQNVDLLAIDVPDPAQLQLPSWETSRLLAPTVFKRRTDLSAKRNMALVLSRMLGWSRVLFLDDDITELNPDDVRRASGLLDTHNAVGLHIGGFPDHSVVGHAYLQAGGRQQSFISGRALVVHLERSDSFFPDIHNDDWFFLLDSDRGIQPVGVTGAVRQFPYDPFRNPDRARTEEFGDVLAEGIYWLLDQGRSVTDADQAHWAKFLVKRKDFIGYVLKMVEQDGTLESADRARRIAALKGSLGRLALITPELCEGYLRAWAVDRQRWQRHLKQPFIRNVQQLPTDVRRERALAALSRPGAPSLTWRCNAQGAAMPMNATGPLIGAVSPLNLDLPSAVAMDADQAENEASTALAEHSFDHAVALLEKAMVLDPDRAERLQDDLTCLSAWPDDSPGQLAWRRGVWLALAAGSPFQLPDPEPSYIVPQAAAESVPVTTLESGVEEKQSLSYEPQKVGEDLEVAFIRLLKTFFSLASDDEREILKRLRRQKPGPQFGHDVQFDCTSATNSIVRCHVECKNYKRNLKPADVAEKIWQMRTYWERKQIDYFLIVTPRAGISDELDYLIQMENSRDDSRFQIEVWGPEEGIEQFFALEPSAYRRVYRKEPPVIPDIEALVAAWSGKLKPVVRLPPSLKAYLTKPRMHSLPGEDSAHFDALFDECVEIDAVDPAGSPMGKLSDVLADWIDDPARRQFLLLGEFGDGKSFAGYRLTRLLSEKYPGNPTAGHFPLRLRLRDLTSAGTPQELLSRRLQALGADMRDWALLQDLGPTLIVLDGFDEMSDQLDHATVADNLRLLADCVQYFDKSKILVTSRTHYFESSRMQERFLEHLDRPRVARLAPLPLSERLSHLHAYAKQQGLSDKFERIRHLYDPIGLAGKPLFLQMIKETMPNLPDDYFDEIVLYETSVRDSLGRKPYMLQDKHKRTLQREAIQGMTELLELLAVELLKSGGEPVDLRAFGGEKLNVAQVLWKMSQEDAGTEQTQDAQARFGMRSLIRPFPKEDDPEAWPVAFCHRSMAEYFVAHALVRALRHNDSMAQELLSSVILRPEIVDFATLLINKDDDAAAVAHSLARLARHAVLRSKPGYLGGNAITLAYRARWKPSDHNWVGLDLSYADLSGANLTGAKFKNSSLQYATLDNADLSGADLTGCDLTGVRLEETAPVTYVAPGRIANSSVVACYGDGTIREWLLVGSRPGQQKLLDGLGSLKSAAWGPYGDLIVVDGSRLLLWKVSKDGSVQNAAFSIRSGTEHIRFTYGAVSFVRTEGDQHIAISVDCETAVGASTRLEYRGPVAFAANKTALMALGGNVVAIARLNRGDQLQIEVPDADVTAADVRHEKPDLLQVIVGDSKGQVTSMQVTVDGNVSEPDVQATRQVHEGPVLSATFFSNGLVATGGMDRSLAIYEWDSGQLRDMHRLKVTLRCAGIKTTGVQGDRERQLLEALRERAEEAIPALDM